MIPFLRSVFLGVFILVLSMSLQFAIPAFLPSPLSTINVLFLLLTLLILFGRERLALVLSLLLHLMLERVSGTLFGIILFSSALGTLGMVWLSRRVLTNRSFFAGFALCFLGLVFYRTAYLLFVFITSPDLPFSLSLHLRPVALEVAVTSISLSILYFGAVRIMASRKRPTSRPLL